MTSWRYIGPPSFEKTSSRVEEDQWKRHFGGNDPVFTFKCRCAIAVGCSMLKLKPGDEVLVPDYHCGSEMDVLIALGLEPRVFEVDETFGICWDDVDRLVTEKTKALYLIGYFGVRPPMERAREFCDTHQLFLIEDAALTLLSDHSQDLIPDVLVASLPKFLGFMNGGLLLSGLDPRLIPPGSVPGSAGRSSDSLRLLRRGVLRTLGNSLLRPLGRGIERSGKHQARPDEAPASESPQMPSSYFFDAETRNDWKCPPWIVNSIRRIDLKRIRSLACRANRLVLDATPWPADWRLLSPIPTETLLSPVIALQAPDVKSADAAAAALGSCASRWWQGRHPRLASLEGEATRCRKDRLLAVRVHHQMSDSDLEFLIDRLSTVTC